MDKEWIKKMSPKLLKKARGLQGIWNFFEGGDIVPDIYISNVRLGREKKGL